MTIPFYVQGQLMTSITPSIVVPLISNKFVEQSRMSMSHDNKLLNTLADPVITKTLRWVTTVMEKSCLSNNTIDNKATIVGLFSSFSNKTGTKPSIIQSQRLQFRVTKE